MSNSTYFVQECPTCGRRLNIRVEYLGRRVACQHCSRQFVACDASNGSLDASQSSSALLKRAEELLQSAQRGSDRARNHHPR
jgi:DNA-directed RNA polymerase subunit RPC12/RpoP